MSFFKLPNPVKKYRTVFRHRTMTAYRTKNNIYVLDIRYTKDNYTIFRRDPPAAQDYVYHSTFMDISR